MVEPADEHNCVIYTAALIGAWWQRNAKRIDTQSRRNGGRDRTNRGRVARRKHLNPIEALPDCGLVTPPAPPLAGREQLLWHGSVRRCIIVTAPLGVVAYLMLRQHGWDARPVIIACHRIVLDLDYVEPSIGQQSIKQLLHCPIGELKRAQQA